VAVQGSGHTGCVPLPQHISIVLGLNREWTSGRQTTHHTSVQVLGARHQGCI
jgi:hypothetical protein